MPARSVRILTLLLISWANIYCCCSAPAQPVITEHARVGKTDCCAEKHAPSQPAGEHRFPDGAKCKECPFFAIRQTTLISHAHHDVAPPAICPFAYSFEISPLACGLDPARCIDGPNLIKIPTALLDLNTCLLR
jgi:hypothetical protein